MGSVRAMECSSPQPCHFDRVNTLWEIMETFYSVRVGIKRAFLLIHQHWLLYGSRHGKRVGAPLLTKTLLNCRWRNQTTTKVQHWPFKKHHPNLFKGEPVKVLEMVSSPLYNQGSIVYSAAETGCGHYYAAATGIFQPAIIMHTEWKCPRWACGAAAQPSTKSLKTFNLAFRGGMLY